MLMLLLCAAMIVAWRWPQTPVGRVLHRLMVDWPARLLAKWDPGKVMPKLAAGKVLFGLMIVLAVLGAAALAQHGAIFLAQGAPEVIAWFAAFDVATYIDVIALALVLGATVRLRAAYAAIRTWLARSTLSRLTRRPGGARSRSPRPERKAPPPSNDDEPAWPAFGLAYG